MDDLDKLKKIAKQEATAKARIEGRIESEMEELKDAGFNSTEDAVKGLTKISKYIDKKKAMYKKKLKRFQKKYAIQLSEIN